MTLTCKNSIYCYFFIGNDLLLWQSKLKNSAIMSVNLCVDWGNTSIKAAIFVDNKITESHTFSDDKAHDGVSAMITLHKPVKAILCSVANHPADFEELLKGSVKSFLNLNTNTSLPIMNAYASADTLGVDRLALAVGAYADYPNKNVLVVSAGSCLTMNFVQSNRAFRGGSISPGLQMRLRAMNEFTDKLPKVKVDGELIMLGYDTDTNMRSGAVYGMIFEIDGMINDYMTHYPDFNAILTGGDAPYFANKLKSKIFADPDVLLKGLNLILNHNVPVPR
jgi:type III pantothenate kinase